MISGASRGIGRSIAKRMLDDGHRISLGLRNTDDLLDSKLDPMLYQDNRVISCCYDARDSITASNWVKQTFTHFSNVDTLIHCAGIFYNTSLLFTDKQQHQINDLWNINVMGPWLLTRALWPYLICSTSPRIIVLVSMSGKRSKGSLAGYTASKFALMGLCETIRNEGWSQGLRVTAICPGWVNTDMSSSVTQISKNEMTQPEDIASLTSHLLDLPDSCVPFELSMNCVLER